MLRRQRFGFAAFLVPGSGGGPSPTCSPLNGWFWVDGGTAVAPENQDGSECRPFATIQQAVNAAIALPSVTAWTFQVAANTYAEGGTLDMTGLAAASLFQLNGAELDCDVLVAGSRVRMVDGEVTGEVSLETIGVFEFERLPVQGGYAEGAGFGDVFLRAGSHCSATANLPNCEVTVESSNVTALVANVARCSGPGDGVTGVISQAVISGSFEGAGCRLAVLGELEASWFVLRDCLISGPLEMTNENSVSTLQDCTWTASDGGGGELAGDVGARFLLDAWTYGDFTRVAGTVVDATLRVKSGGVQPPIDKGALGAAPALDFLASANQVGTLDAAATFTFASDPPPGTEVTITLTQGGAGGFAVTLPGNVTLLGSASPASTAPGDTNILWGWFDGADYWLQWAPQPSSGGGAQVTPQPWLEVNFDTAVPTPDQVGSEQAPFATVQQAFDFIEANPIPDARWTVNVAGGIYAEVPGITLQDADVTLLGNGSAIGDIAVEVVTGVINQSRFRIVNATVPKLEVLTDPGCTLLLDAEDVDLVTSSTFGVLVNSGSSATVRLSSTRATSGLELGLGARVTGTLGAIQAPGCTVALLNMFVDGAVVCADLLVEGGQQRGSVEVSGGIQHKNTYFVPPGPNTLEKTGAAGSWLLDGYTQRSFAQAGGALTNLAYSVQDQPSSAVQAHGALGVAETFDFNATPNHSGTLDSNVTFTFTPPPPGTEVSINLTEDGTGGHTMTWPASVLWLGGSAPPPAAANTKSRAKGQWDGTNYWLAWLTGYG